MDLLMFNYKDNVITTQFQDSWKCRLREVWEEPMRTNPLSQPSSRSGHCYRTKCGHLFCVNSQTSQPSPYWITKDNGSRQFPAHFFPYFSRDVAKINHQLTDWGPIATWISEKHFLIILLNKKYSIVPRDCIKDSTATVNICFYADKNQSVTQAWVCVCVTCK